MSENFYLKICNSILYGSRILIFINCSSLLVFWVAMEINIILLVTRIYTFLDDQKKSVSSGAFRYLIVQTLGRLVFFARVCLEFSSNSEFAELILIASLSAKMGIFPFHSWIFQIESFINKISMTLILSTQKIPIIIILGRTSSRGGTIIITLTALAGSFILIRSKNLTDLVVSSSIYFTFWSWNLWIVGMKVFLTRYIIYTVFTLILMKMGEYAEKGFRDINLKRAVVLSSLFLIGLPPARMFFFKLQSVQMIWETIGIRVISIVWFSVVLSTLGYLKVFLPLLRVNNGVIFFNNSNAEISLKASLILQFFFLICRVF